MDCNIYGQTNVTKEQRGGVFRQLRIRCGVKTAKKTSRRFDLRAFVRTQLIVVRRVSMKVNRGEHMFCMGAKHVTKMGQ